MTAYSLLTKYGTLAIGVAVLAAFALDLATDLKDRVKTYDGTDGTPGSGERRAGGRP